MGLGRKARGRHAEQRARAQVIARYRVPAGDVGSTARRMPAGRRAAIYQGPTERPLTPRQRRRLAHKNPEVQA